MSGEGSDAEGINVWRLAEDAESVEERGRVFPPPKPTTKSRERRELSQRGPAGRSLAENGFLCFATPKCHRMHLVKMSVVN